MKKVLFLTILAILSLSSLSGSIPPLSDGYPVQVAVYGNVYFAVGTPHIQAGSEKPVPNSGVMISIVDINGTVVNTVGSVITNANGFYSCYTMGWVPTSPNVDTYLVRVQALNMVKYTSLNFFSMDPLDFLIIFPPGGGL